MNPGPRPERTPLGKLGTVKSGAPASDSEIPGLDRTARWGAKSLNTLKSLGKRIFAHIVIVAAAAAVAVSAGTPLAGICIYIGGICIIARGMAASPAWLVPAAMGAMQAVLLALSGFPFPQALFWGGAQSWLQRLIQKRCSMGTEWITLLFLLPVSIYLLGHTQLFLLAGSFAGMAATGGMLTLIASRLYRKANAGAMPKPAPLEPERVALYRAFLAEFGESIRKLPQSARVPAESIAALTGSILDSMAADPRDLEQGHRFLNRYFKAARSVVDRHTSLAREKTITPDIMEALVKSEEMLSRLDAVFAKEHVRLLENDVTDFSTDLAVIDTLLKMDGK